MKARLEQTIREIEVMKNNKVAEIKDRVVREKIAPYNANIDQLRAKALAELEAELNGKIVELKTIYETKKQELVRLGEEDKKANADSILASEVASVIVKYDKMIARLNADIAELIDNKE